MMDESSASTNKSLQQAGRSLFFPSSSPSLYRRSIITSSSLLPVPVLTSSGFFKDIFSLPDTDDVSFPNQPIDLDEPAEVIERVLHGLYASRLNDCSNPSLEILHAAIRFHDKFNIETGLKTAEEALQLGITRDPFAAFAYASQRGDLALGRQAIRLIRVGSGGNRMIKLWSMMSEAKPSWQLALAELEPAPSCDYSVAVLCDFVNKDGSSSHVSIKTRFEIDMDEVAARFDPK
jgi:hypothetical protein